MVLLIRHCESEFNEMGVSSRDCGLTDLGKSQAKLLTGRFVLVMCSSLRRARETLELSSIVGEHVSFSEKCREFRQAECDFMDGENMDMETESELMKRIEHTKEVVALFEGDGWDVCIITHADFIFHYTKYEKNGETFGKWVGNGESYETLDVSK